MSDETRGLSMSRDPAPDPDTPHGGQAPAAQPLTEIVLSPPARPIPTTRAAAGGAARDGAHDRRPAGVGPGRDDHPRRVPGARHRHADPVLRGEPHAGQCLPRVRRRGDRSRVLAPACSRPVEPGMEVQTDTERVRTSRKVVLEFLGVVGRRVADRSGHPGRDDPRVHGPVRTPIPAASARRPSPRPPASATPTTPDIITPRGPTEAAFAATVAQPTKIDNDLYVRDYSKCILCYKCVEACGEDAQNTFAIAVAGVASTRASRPSRPSRCRSRHAVYCGNCIGVCPTGALMAKTEYDMREADTWDESAQTVTSHDLPVLRRRLRRRPARPGRPHPQGDVAARLDDHRRPPLHQGSVRFRVRERAPEAVGVTLSPAERDLLADARRATLGTSAGRSTPPRADLLRRGRRHHVDAARREAQDVADPRALAHVRDIEARPEVALLVNRSSEDSATGVASPRGRARSSNGRVPGGILPALRASTPKYERHELERRP